MLKRLLTVSRTQVYSYCLALQLSFVRCCFTSFSARSFTALGLIPSMRGQASQRFLDTVSQLPEVTGRRNMSSSATTWRNNTRSSVTLNFRHGLLPGLIGEEGPTSASMVEIYIPEDKRKRHFNTAGGNYLCMKWKKKFVAWLYSVQVLVNSTRTGWRVRPSSLVIPGFEIARETSQRNPTRDALVLYSFYDSLKPDLYYEKIAATCDTRHVAATCDSDGRFILFCRKSSATSGKYTWLANAQLATWVSHVAMHVASHVAMHAVAKVEPGSTFAMSRCDSLRQPATGVSPVAKLVAKHVAAIFHSINRA